MRREIPTRDVARCTEVLQGLTSLTIPSFFFYLFSIVIVFTIFFSLHLRVVLLSVQASMDGAVRGAFVG